MISMFRRKKFNQTQCRRQEYQAAANTKAETKSQK